MSIIDVPITTYIEKHIVTQYSQFDRAHNLDHVRRVIQNSFEIAKDYLVNLNMVYVVAAYHDIGLLKGRKDHEKNSAAFLLADKKLRDWFSQDEIHIMAQAVEDHRASSDHEPRSIYGKIIADADNDLEYFSVLTRCVQHGLAYFPHYDQDTHFDRVIEHLTEKYGEGGYLQTWLNSEHDRRGLSKIRNKLASDLKGLRADFDKIMKLEGSE